jgi:hypothetical protein
VAALIIGGVAWYSASRSNGGGGATAEVMPPGLTGRTTVQAAAHQVPNTSGIPGVTECCTTGWPTGSHSGPAALALAHDRVTGQVTYSVTPPVGGTHNATWMNCGIYDKPVANERAVHNLEHGAVWITYQPSLPPSEVSLSTAFAAKQTMITLAGGTACPA